MEIFKRDARFQASANTLACEDALQGAEIGELVEYAKLLAACGATNVDSIRHNIHSAIRRLEKEGLVFINVNKLGYRRLNSQEIVGENNEKNRASLRRKARRSARQLVAADYDELDSSQRLEFNAQVAIYGAMHELGKARSVRKITADMKQAEPLTIRQALKLYLKPKDEGEE